MRLSRTPNRALPTLLVLVLVGITLAVGVTLASPPTATGAQAPCVDELEPNDSQASVPSYTGAFCLTGSLPTSADQDLLVWEPTTGDPAARWTVTLTGVPGVLTILTASAVTSPPGDPVGVGTQIVDLRVAPEQIGSAVAADLLLAPGRVLFGVARSDRPDGAEVSDTGYRISVEPGTPLPAPGDEEPNDVPDTATKLEGAFALGGDLAGSIDLYRWTIPQDGPNAWTLEAQGAVAGGVGLSLSTAAGDQLGGTRAGADGRAQLRDLHLVAGRYLVMLSGGPPEPPSPYALVARAEEGVGDPEPNDTPELAAALTPGTPAQGRLTGLEDTDLYRVSLEAGGQPHLLDVRLIWRSGADRELCLRTPDMRALQCRRGTAGLSLKDLLLADDRYVLSVRGPSDPDDRYVLRADTTSAPADDMEAEPNDLLEMASRLPLDRSIRGAGASGDEDFFVTVASGEAQLWALRSTGEGIEAVDWLGADLRTLGSAEVAPDRTSATLLDMYFVPGLRQFFRVRGSGGEYRLELEPLGPPDPTASASRTTTAHLRSHSRSEAVGPDGSRARATRTCIASRSPRPNTSSCGSTHRATRPWRCGCSTTSTSTRSAASYPAAPSVTT